MTEGILRRVIRREVRYNNRRVDVLECGHIALWAAPPRHVNRATKLVHRRCIPCETAASEAKGVTR